MQYQVQSRFLEILDLSLDARSDQLRSKSYRETLPISTVDEDGDIYVSKIYQCYRIIPTYKAEKTQPDLRKFHVIGSWTTTSYVFA